MSTSIPNNIVKINPDEVFLITRIKKEKHNITFHGNIFKDVTDTFKFPCRLTKIGIMKLGRLSKTEKVVPLENVLTKCVLFENNNNVIIAITYLHDS